MVARFYLLRVSGDGGPQLDCVGQSLMKKLCLILALAALAPFSRPASAQTTLTGTFLTISGQTPQAASLKVLRQVNGTNVCGEMTFVPYNSATGKEQALLWNGTTYPPQPVNGYIRCSDGKLINSAGAAGVSIIPNSDSSPSGNLTWMRGGLDGSTDGSVRAVSWSEAKIIPDQTTVDWGGLPVATIVDIGYQTIEANGTALNPRTTVNIYGPAVICTDNVSLTRTDCDITGSGTSLQTNAVANSDQSVLNFITSTAFHGLTITPASATGGTEQFNLSGTLAPDVFGSESPNCVFAGPASGLAANPTCRALVAADIPALSYVTSVGLSTNAGWLSVGSSPVTSSGTIALNLATGLAQNQVLATPNGLSGPVGLRALVVNDLPTGIPNANLANSSVTINAPSLMANWGAVSLGGSLSPIWSVLGADYVPTSTAANTVAWEQINGGASCGDATHALSYSTTTHTLGCQALSATSLTTQTNGVANTSQTTLNFVNPANFNGLTFTFSNPTAGNETFTVGGTLGNAGLANSSVTYNGVPVSLGATGNLGQLNDTNGNPTIKSTATLSAVDYLNATNAATGSPATVAFGAAGTDASINLNLTTKGTGVLEINGNALYQALCSAGQFSQGLSASGNNCATPSGSGTITGSPQYEIPDYSTAGTASTLTGTAWLTGYDGVAQTLTESTSGGANTAPVAAVAGIAINSSLGVSPYSMTITDRDKLLENAPSSSFTINLPNGATAGFGSNFAASFFNMGGTACDVLTAPTGVNLNGVLVGSLNVCGNAAATLFQDASNNLYLHRTWDISAFPISASFLATDANGKPIAAISDTTFSTGTTAISANTCTTASTVTMTGVTTSAVFVIGPSSDVSAVTGWGATGGLVIEAWPTANTLNYKVCNQTGSTITPGAVTWNAGVR